jgi:alginate O-acetyltransferase complex protein AlgI
MAVGLGRILGFRFPENFDLPYSARSVTEFWRRWHMSLSRWFKDYVYVPLGGNRVGAARTYANLVAVFLLCGLWHGASWTFVVWGAFHGFFHVIERAGLRRLLDRAPASVAHLYCLLVVLASWVIFRSETLSDALTMLQVGAGLGSTPTSSPLLADFSTPWVVAVGIAGCLGSARWSAAGAWLRARAPWSHDARSGAWLGTALSSLGMAALLYASASRLAAETYRAFIYFQF